MTDTTKPTPLPCNNAAIVILVAQPLRTNEQGSWQSPPQLEALILHKVENGTRLFTADQMTAHELEGYRRGLEAAADIAENADIDLST